MPGTAGGAAVLLATLALIACSPEQPEPTGKESAQAVERYGPQSEVPAEYLGRWELTHQVCEPDTEEVPDTDLPEVLINFLPDHSYEMVVEGWLGRGTFTVEAFVDDNRLKLDDTLLNFRAVDGKLENWSEGEAVYLCGNVFERRD